MLEYQKIAQEQCEKQSFEAMDAISQMEKETGIDPRFITPGLRTKFLSPFLDRKDLDLRLDLQIINSQLDLI